MIPASAPAPADILSAFQAAMSRVVSLRLDLRWYPNVTSTMDVAEEAVQGGAPEGLVIMADEQTHGRGRRGRPWSSPAGAGLYLTFVLRPPCDGGGSSVLALLTLGAGVGLRSAIARATGLETELKWPNDLMVGGRKLAGILAEGFNLGTAEQTVLIGLGVNILASAHPGEIGRRAISIEAEVGRHVDRAVVLEEVLVAIPQAYDDLRRGSGDDILRAWRAAAPSATGAAVVWHAAGGTRRGVTAGVDERGALLVQTAAGLERIVGGEITWVT